VKEQITPEWITYEEAQRLTSLGRTTLWRICSAEDSGILVARIGRAVRINKEILTDYLRRSAEDAAQQSGSAVLQSRAVPGSEGRQDARPCQDCEFKNVD
jgi:hypothetical protein